MVNKLVKEIQEDQEEGGKGRMTITISPFYHSLTKKVCDLYHIPLSRLVQELMGEFLEEELVDLSPEQIQKMQLNKKEKDFVDQILLKEKLKLEGDNNS